jgi:PilZ domain
LIGETQDSKVIIMNDLELAKKNRRAFLRRPAKLKVKVTCRKGSFDTGPNLAKSVLDISESGIRMVIKDPMKAGQDVSITLEGMMQMRPVKRTGKIIWCVQTTEGDYCIGVLLEKYLPYQDIRLLT